MLVLSAKLVAACTQLNEDVMNAKHTYDMVSQDSKAQIPQAESACAKLPDQLTDERTQPEEDMMCVKPAMKRACFAQPTSDG